MWTFVATYYNRDGKNDIKKTIEIEADNFGLSERQTYMLAMENAYNEKLTMGDAWGLGSVEFISC